jgi:hypothetical protein
MRTVGIWITSLFASAIPFAFVGAVIVFLACVFNAEGEHAPTARSRASLQGEAALPAATPERALVVADTSDDADQRRPGVAAHRHHRDHRAHVVKPWKRGSTRSRGHVRFTRSYYESAYWPRSRDWFAQSTSSRW